jgi:hypothetical protein
MKDLMKIAQLSHHDRYNCSFWYGCAIYPKTIKKIKKYGRKSARRKMKNFSETY